MSGCRDVEGAAIGAAAGTGLAWSLFFMLTCLLGPRDDGLAFVLLLPLWTLLVPLGMVIGGAVGATRDEREPLSRVQF